MLIFEMRNEIVGRKIATDFPAAKQKHFHTHITRIFFVAEKLCISSTTIVPKLINIIQNLFISELAIFLMACLIKKPFGSIYNSGFKRDVFFGAVYIMFLIKMRGLQQFFSITLYLLRMKLILQKYFSGIDIEIDIAHFFFSY